MGAVQTIQYLQWALLGHLVPRGTSAVRRHQVPCSITALWRCSMLAVGLTKANRKHHAAPHGAVRRCLMLAVDLTKIYRR